MPPEVNAVACRRRGGPISASSVATLGRGAMRIAGLMRAMAVGSVLLVMLTVHRDTFDRSFYRARYSFSRLVRWVPLIEFCFRGSRALRDPSPRFSQIGYAEMFPFTFGYPPILHVLLFRLNQFVPDPPQANSLPQPEPEAHPLSDEGSSGVTPQQRLQELWPQPEPEAHPLI